MKQKVDSIHQDKDFYITFDPPENLEITDKFGEDISLTEVSRLYFNIDLTDDGGLDAIHVVFASKYIGEIRPRDEDGEFQKKINKALAVGGYIHAAGAINIELVEFIRIMSYHKSLYTTWVSNPKSA